MSAIALAPFERPFGDVQQGPREAKETTKQRLRVSDRRGRFENLPDVNAKFATSVANLAHDAPQREDNKRETPRGVSLDRRLFSQRHEHPRSPEFKPALPAIVQRSCA